MGKGNLRLTNSDWKHVVLQDEKTFNLDEPDGVSYYCHNIRSKPEVYSKRAQWDRAVMVWSANSFHEKINLAKIDVKTDLEFYTEAS